MRVANLSDTYVPHNNGIAAVLHNIHHAKKDWEDKIIGPMDNPEVIKVAGLPFPPFPDYKLALDTGSLRGTLSRFDVLHNHTPYGMFYYGLKYSKELNLPLVGTFHTDPAAIYGAFATADSRIGKLSEKVLWRYLIGIYNRCEKVVAVSRWLKEELERRGMKREVVHIPNGVDTVRFNPNADTSEFNKIYNPDNKPLVLFVGRLQYKKDPITFVKAAMRSKKDAVFVVAGRGELREQLIEMSKGDPRIVYAGFLPESMLTAAYCAADVYVMPSESETQGMVLLEAMACGSSCISTKVGIAEEVVADPWLFEVGDYVSLSEKIDALLEDNKYRDKYSKSARKLMEGEYSIAANARKLRQVYEEVL